MPALPDVDTLEIGFLVSADDFCRLHRESREIRCGGDNPCAFHRNRVIWRLRYHFCCWLQHLRKSDRADFAASPAAQQGDRWAAVVGVNDYMARGRDLRYCVADAELFADTLVSHCGFDRERILLFTDNSSEAHLKPLSANLKTQIPKWLKHAKSGDTVIVFFSGHGYLNGYGEGFLAPKDCNVGRLRKTSLAINDLRDALRSCPAARKMLILDCCHAGAGDRRPIGSSSEDLRIYR